MNDESFREGSDGRVAMPKIIPKTRYPRSGSPNSKNLNEKNYAPSKEAKSAINLPKPPVLPKSAKSWSSQGTSQRLQPTTSVPVSPQPVIPRPLPRAPKQSIPPRPNVRKNNKKETRESEKIDNTQQTKEDMLDYLDGIANSKEPDNSAPYSVTDSSRNNNTSEFPMKSSPPTPSNSRIPLSEGEKSDNETNYKDNGGINTDLISEFEPENYDFPQNEKVTEKSKFSSESGEIPIIGESSSGISGKLTTVILPSVTLVFLIIIGILGWDTLNSRTEEPANRETQRSEDTTNNLQPEFVIDDPIGNKDPRAVIYGDEDDVFVFGPENSKVYVVKDEKDQKAIRIINENADNAKVALSDTLNNYISVDSLVIPKDTSIKVGIDEAEEVIVDVYFNGESKMRQQITVNDTIKRLVSPNFEHLYVESLSIPLEKVAEEIGIMDDQTSRFTTRYTINELRLVKPSNIDGSWPGKPNLEMVLTATSRDNELGKMVSYPYNNTCYVMPTGEQRLMEEFGASMIDSLGVESPVSYSMVGLSEEEKVFQLEVQCNVDSGDSKVPQATVEFEQKIEIKLSSKVYEETDSGTGE